MGMFLMFLFLSFDFPDVFLGTLRRLIIVQGGLIRSTGVVLVVLVVVLVVLGVVLVVVEVVASHYCY